MDAYVCADVFLTELQRLRAGGVQELSLAGGSRGSHNVLPQRAWPCRGGQHVPQCLSILLTRGHVECWGPPGTLYEPPQCEGESLAGRQISGRHWDFCNGDGTGWPPQQRVPQGACCQVPGGSGHPREQWELLLSHWVTRCFGVTGVLKAIWDVWGY